MRARHPAAAGAALLAAAFALPAGAGCDGQAAGHDSSRLVSVGGGLTEIVYALGAEDRLVGVDSTSIYPPEAEALPDVGYVRALPAEGVLSLTPTLVLAEDDAGPAAALEQIRMAGTEVVVVPDDHTIAGVAAKIETVAGLLGCPEAATPLAEALVADAAALAAELEDAPGRPSVLFLLSIGQGAPLGGGAGTSADGIIALAGGTNALAAIEGYKPVSIEAAIAAQPDVILMTEASVAAMGGTEAVLALPQVALTSAGAQGRVVAMDGLLLLGFGPRTAQAARELAVALHGEAIVAVAP